MFPKETDIKISENIAELKERELGPLKTSKRLPENHLPRNSPQYQSDLPEVSRRNHGNLYLLLDGFLSCVSLVWFKWSLFSRVT